jgi:phage terminase Nu1 subunit (DNA packaging protein)
MPKLSNIITTKELASMLGISEATVRKWRHLGIGPRYIRLGKIRGRAVYSMAAVESWLAENEAGSTSEELARDMAK